LAITSAKRLATAPEIPTVAESGMAGFEFVSWYGLWAPKGLPPDLVAKLQSEVAKIVALPDVKQRLDTLGFEPVGSTTDTFVKYIADEMTKSGKIIDDARIKTE
jgi:tripartite-type tricarboxylate transporter receptor subunit TctC